MYWIIADLVSASIHLHQIIESYLLSFFSAHLVNRRLVHILSPANCRLLKPLFLIYCIQNPKQIKSETLKPFSPTIAIAMAMARDAPSPPHPFEIHMVASAASPEFALLRRTLRRSRAVALDAEWKPRRSRPSSSSSADPSPSSSSSLFPPVTLLQIACRAVAGEGGGGGSSSPVFIVDLLAVAAEALWEPLRELFESPEVLKLGFRFKQDLVYLSSTFSSHGCDPGFDRVNYPLLILEIFHLCHKTSPFYILL